MSERVLYVKFFNKVVDDVFTELRKVLLGNGADSGIIQQQLNYFTEVRNGNEKQPIQLFKVFLTDNVRNYRISNVFLKPLRL